MTYTDFPLPFDRRSTFRPARQEAPAIFSREKFAEAVSDLEAQYDLLDQKGEQDMTRWIQFAGRPLLKLLEASPEHWERMKSAMDRGAPGTVFEIATQVLRESSS